MGDEANGLGTESGGFDASFEEKSAEFVGGEAVGEVEDEDVALYGADGVDVREAFEEGTKVAGALVIDF